jgi:hypothetical protein
MLLLILLFNGIPYWKAVRSGTKSLPFTRGPFDKWRFFGTLVLTIAYFLSMQYVGEIFPNTGLGFLFVSMPYMLLLSWLFLHVRDKKHLLIVTVNSIVGPLVVWYVLAQLFGITLP